MILQQAIDRAQFAKLLAEKKTDLLKGFVSKKTGRKFEAFLVIKEGEVSFEFAPRPARAKGNAAGRKPSESERDVPLDGQMGKKRVVLEDDPDGAALRRNPDAPRAVVPDLAAAADRPTIGALESGVRAVREVEGRPSAFVELEPGRYEARPVMTEPLADGRLRVLSGLAVGDAVVTEGAFTLASELAKAELEGE